MMNSELKCDRSGFDNSLYSIPNSFPRLHPAIFVDRDGVLIETRVSGGIPHPPRRPNDVRIEPGASAAIDRFRHAGFKILVVTNQPDPARGVGTREEVEATHERMRQLLPPLDGIYTCYHDTPDNCACRKPKAGLLLAAAAEHGVDLAKSYLIGDRWSDVAAGASAGCRTILLDRAYSDAPRCSPTHVVADLLQAAEWILSSTEQRR